MDGGGHDSQARSAATPVAAPDTSVEISQVRPRALAGLQGAVVRTGIGSVLERMGTDERADVIRGMQRTAGNQAVARALGGRPDGLPVRTVGWTPRPSRHHGPARPQPRAITPTTPQVHRTPTDTAGAASTIDYDSLCDATGHMVGDDQAPRVFALVRDPAKLDQLYADAEGGNKRAATLIADVEEVYAGVGNEVAAQNARLVCALPVVHEVLPGCIPNWSEIAYLKADQRG